MSLASLLLVLAGCRPTLPPADATSAAPPAALEGRVTYERRYATERGLTRATQTRPARHVSVEAVDAHGVIVASTRTDEQGRWRLAPAPPVPVRIRALSVVVVDGADVRVLQSPRDRRPHELSTPLLPLGPHRVELHAGLGGPEPGGAFHVLDLFLEGVQAVRGAIGVTLPPLIGLWRRGNTTQEAHTSFFAGASSTTAGGWELQLMGGAAGQEDSSDSDQFDSGIVLHELGHFVNRVLGADASIAGQHDRRRAMVPGVAFDEAFATFFACAVLRDPLYLDTVGVEPAGSIRMREHMENAGPENVRGVGAETTTFELLWDMADGTAELPDHDGDGVVVGLAGVLRVIASFDRGGDDVPYIGLFLQRAVALGVLTDAQVTHLVKQPQPQGLSWPLAGGDVWPTDVTLPATLSGKVDGLTDPQPSGGRPDPHNGLEAVQVYRLRLRAPARLSAALTIAGSGRAADHTDVDLVLYDVDTEPIALARGELATERIEAPLAPGTYLLYVSDGGTGNRASYSLDLRADPTHP